MGFYEKFNHCCFIFYLNLRLAVSNLELQISQDIVFHFEWGKIMIMQHLNQSCIQFKCEKQFIFMLKKTCQIEIRSFHEKNVIVEAQAGFL